MMLPMLVATLLATTTATIVDRPLLETGTLTLLEVLGLGRRRPSRRLVLAKTLIDHLLGNTLLSLGQKALLIYGYREFAPPAEYRGRPASPRFDYPRGGPPEGRFR